MAKKKEAEKPEVEVIEITNEDVSVNEGRAWSEEFGEAGQEAKRFAQTVWKEGNMRRVVVRNQEGETVLNLPVAVGAIGLFPPLFAPMIGVAAVGTAVALLAKCKISFERQAVENTEAA